MTSVWVPDAAHQALRDLVRARAAAKQDESRAKHRLIKYLLRNGWRNPENRRAWTHPWWRWLQSLKLSHATQQTTLLSRVAEVLHQGERVSRFNKDIELAVESASPEKEVVIEALQALRSVAKLTAITIVTEIGTFQRIRKPTELMGYTGLVPSEYSSGGRESKGRITRTGNARLRHVLGETACHTRHKPWLSNGLKQVLPNLPPGVAEIAWKAQERLHRKVTKMTFQRRLPGKVMTALARELVGFI